MATSDLVSLDDLKSWLDMTGSGKDGDLGRLISATSRWVYNQIGRETLAPTTYTEVRDGYASSNIILRNWPVISVTSLSVDGYPIQQASPLVPNGTISGGYVLEPPNPNSPGQVQRLYLRGASGTMFAPYTFTKRQQNIIVVYTAGYQITGEVNIVPSVTPYQITVQAPYGPWLSDVGVTYANGTPLAKVATSPSVGQYAVYNGLYQFNAADAGMSLLMTYGYVPADLNQAVKEVCAERLKYSERIGVISKQIGGQETVSYAQKAIPDYLMLAIAPYKRVHWI